MIPSVRDASRSRNGVAKRRWVSDHRRRHGIAKPYAVVTERRGSGVVGAPARRLRYSARQGRSGAGRLTVRKASCAALPPPLPRMATSFFRPLWTWCEIPRLRSQARSARNDRGGASQARCPVDGLRSKRQVCVIAFAERSWDEAAIYWSESMYQRREAWLGRSARAAPLSGVTEPLRSTSRTVGLGTLRDGRRIADGFARLVPVPGCGEPPWQG